MKTPIDLDEDLLARAAMELGTTTKKDTVNESLRFVAERRNRAQSRIGSDPLSLGIGQDAGDPAIRTAARR